MKTSSEPNPLAPSANIESSSKTEFMVLKCSHTWTINNFSYCWMKPGEVLKSQTFFSESDDTIKWCLAIYPGGKNVQNKNYVALYLTLVSGYKADIKGKYKFSILNEKREKIHMWEIQEPVTFLKKKEQPSFGCIKYVKRSFLMDNVNGLLPDGKLTILCELTASMIIPNMPAPSGNVLLTNHWGCTKIDVVKLSYTWSIKNFTFCNQKPGTVMVSPIFPPGENSKFQWYLRLFPNGRDEANKENISIFLFTSKPNEIDVNAMFKISIINSKKEKTNTYARKEPYTFVKGSICCDGAVSIVTRDFLLNKANDLIPADKLTICCEVNYITDVVNTSGESKPVTLRIP